MKALFMTAVLALSLSSVSAFAAQTMDDGEICFNDKRTSGKTVKGEKKDVKKVKADTVVKE